MPSFYKFWLSFFQGAGIPDQFSAEYARAFNENRIRPDMLMELDKKMLGEMGVIAMGDKFAIIRHAALTNEKLRLSEIDGDIEFDPKLLADSDENQPAKEPPPPRPPTPVETSVPEPEDPGSPSQIPLPPSPSQPPSPQPPENNDIITPKVTFVDTFDESSEVLFRKTNQYSDTNKETASASASLPSWDNFSQYGYGTNGDVSQMNNSHCNYATIVGSYATAGTDSTTTVSAAGAAGYYFYSTESIASFNLGVPRYPHVSPSQLLGFQIPESQPSSSQYESSDYHDSEYTFSHGRTRQSTYNHSEDDQPPVKRVFLFDPPKKKPPPRQHIRPPEDDKNDLSRYYPPVSQKEIEFAMELKSSTPIGRGNVGFEMLRKMGWNKGNALGNGTGITEPIKLEIRRGRKGLGASGNVEDNRAKKYVKFVTSSNPADRTIEPTALIETP